MATQTLNAQEIQHWLTQHLSELLGIATGKIESSVSFDRYGLDSSAAISVTESLGRYVGRELEPTLLQDYPNIKALSEHLSGR